MSFKGYLVNKTSFLSVGIGKTLNEDGYRHFRGYERKTFKQRKKGNLVDKVKENFGFENFEAKDFEWYFRKKKKSGKYVREKHSKVSYKLMRRYDLFVLISMLSVISIQKALNYFRKTKGSSYFKVERKSKGLQEERESTNEMTNKSISKVTAEEEVRGVGRDQTGLSEFIWKFFESNWI